MVLDHKPVHKGPAVRPQGEAVPGQRDRREQERSSPRDQAGHPSPNLPAHEERASQGHPGDQETHRSLHQHGQAHGRPPDHRPASRLAGSFQHLDPCQDRHRHEERQEHVGHGSPRQESGERVRGEGQPRPQIGGWPEPPASCPGDEENQGHSRQRGPEAHGEFRHPEDAVAQGDEPVEEDGLVEAGATVEVGRDPVPGREHLPGGLGVGRLVRVEQARSPEPEEEEDSRQEQECQEGRSSCPAVHGRRARRQGHWGGVCRRCCVSEQTSRAMKRWVACASRRGTPTGDPARKRPPLSWNRYW